MFEKKLFEIKSINKQLKEDLYIFIRKEAQCLTKFRHPNVLRFHFYIIFFNKITFFNLLIIFYFSNFFYHF